MWTFKRVLILLGGLLVTVSGFGVYTVFLGGIDGLPPLPTEYYPPDPSVQGPRKLGSLDPSIADQKLEQAFGATCEELRRPYRLWLPEKNIGFAAGQFEIDKDDNKKVRLAPFSVAMYHKSKSPGAYPEISTIQSDIAWLTLDRPVSVLSELTNRKVIGVELQGKQPGIRLGNNRRTAEKSDDLDVLITDAPLFYEERRNLIWSDGVVRLTDNQTKPPTIISGRKMQMILAKDTSAPRPTNARVQPAAKNNDSGGVERLTLCSDVEMHFWVDSRSTFLTGSESAKKPIPAIGESVAEEKSLPLDKSALSFHEGPPIPADKVHIHIKTGGMFVYEVPKEIAWFESPPPDLNAAKTDTEPRYPMQVHVTRLQRVEGKEKLDQLTCDRLDLQFRHRPEGVAAEPGSPGGDKEIETAKATARTNNDVAIALDSERMAAYGNYLFYRAGDAHHGSTTLLKGDPLDTVKDGNRMKCKELLLTAANLDGEGQSAYATGPGKIDMLDSKSSPDNPVFPVHVVWRDKLIVVKDREGNQAFDLMKVYGKAEFIDDVQKQELYGERIFVWMINSRDTDNKKPQANGASKQSIHRVRAQEQVHAKSPEFIITLTNILIMTFVEKNATDDQLPNLDNNSGALPAPNSGSSPGNKAAAGAPAEEEKKPSRPIEVTGNEVTAEVSTLGTKKQLQELVVKGNVFVFQPGEKPGEKSVDIQGQLMTVKHGLNGDTLVVHGDSKKVAQVELEGLILYGPLVTINQGENRADVEGIGAMNMPSNTNFDGTKSTTGTKRITVQWKKNMTFDGKKADFYGAVMAFENGAHSKMLADDMTTILDRVVRFQHAPEQKQKDKEAAKIDRIICNGKVFIDEVKLDDRKEHVEQRTILTGQTFEHDNLLGPAIMVGPGEVHSLGQSNSEMGLGAPAPPAGPPGNRKSEKLVWKLTRVEFPDRMFSNTKASAKNAKFYAGHGTFVEVQSFPTTDINAKMNIDAPPKDGFYLRCELLSVEGRQNGPKTTQYMIGERNVFFRTDQYFGHADIVKYDESTDIVIFEALPGKVVQLYQVVQGGPAHPIQVNSTKVLYNRKTGEMKSEGVKSFSN